MVRERSSNHRRRTQRRYGNQHHLRAAGQRLLADAPDVRTRRGVVDAAQKIVAADAQQHQLRRMFLQQHWQTGKRIGRGITGDTGVDHIPASEPRQYGWVTGIGCRAGAEGQRITEREHGGANRNATPAGALAPTARQQWRQQQRAKKTSS